MADINDIPKSLASDEVLAQQTPEFNNQMSEEQRLQNQKVSEYLTNANANTYTAIDEQRGAPVAINDVNDFETAIISGKYKPEADKQYSVVAPDGRIGTVDSKDLKQVLESGAAKLETNEAKMVREDEEKYGDQNLKAFGAAVARSITPLPISDVAGAAAGYGEELRGLEAANPIVSMAGEVVGTGLGLLTGSSETKFGLKAVEKLGEKAGLQVTKALEKEGLKQITAKNLATRILYKGVEKTAPMAAALAVEGSVQGISRLVTENAFGTADLNAENVISYAGFGALVGGGLGAGLGLAKAVAPSAKAVIGGVIS